MNYFSSPISYPCSSNQIRNHFHSITSRDLNPYFILYPELDWLKSLFEEGRHSEGIKFASLYIKLSINKNVRNEKFNKIKEFINYNYPLLLESLLSNLINEITNQSYHIPNPYNLSNLSLESLTPKLFINSFNLPLDISLEFSFLTKLGENIVKENAPFLGQVKLKNTHLGACLLFSNNLILIPTHIIPDSQISINFPNNPNSYNLDKIFKIGVNYSIVKLDKPVFMSNIFFPKLEALADDELIEQLVLIQYFKLSNNTFRLHVSGNTMFNEQSPGNNFIMGFSETNPGSCGGIYINNKGNIVGFHMGVESNLMFNLKYAVTVSALFRDDLIEGLLQYINLEGYESRKMLTKNINDELNKLGKKDPKKAATIKKNIQYNGKGRQYGVAFNLKNFNNLKMEPLLDKTFNRTYNDCLGKVGSYYYSNKYSITSFIESDHFIPKYVLSKTNHRKIREYWHTINEMPAITILLQ